MQLSLRGFTFLGLEFSEDQATLDVCHADIGIAN